VATIVIEGDASTTRHPLSFASLRPAWSGDSFKILPNEIIRLGDDDGEGEHNPFAKMSLSKSKMSGIGLPISNKPLEKLSIVLTLWSDDKIIPARVINADLGCEIELAEAPKEGERCFIVDRQGSRLITVSMESSGNEYLKIVNPNSFLSWLSVCKSNAVIGDGRFAVVKNGESFEINDSKRARKYIGKLVHSDEVLAGYEISAISRMLAAKGLGAILPIYNMEIHAR
jgi:hypothetical protein